MDRSLAMQDLSNLYKTFVTVEPIMKFNLEHFVKMIRRCRPAQVNIGADSGGNNLPESTSDEIFALINELNKFTKVVLKSNLKRIYKP